MQCGGVPTRLAKSTRSSGSTDVGTPFGCATVDYPAVEKDKGPLVIRPRKEAPKERLEILGRQAQM